MRRGFTRSDLTITILLVVGTVAVCNYFPVAWPRIQGLLSQFDQGFDGYGPYPWLCMAPWLLYCAIVMGVCLLIARAVALSRAGVRRQTSRNKGFTLIELLVVIAIIAILAAILFPVFSKARTKGHQAACQSNLKQIALAMIMYCGDHDGIGPAPYWNCVTDTNGKTAVCHAGLKLGPYDAPFINTTPNYSTPGGVGSWSINPLWICQNGRASTYQFLLTRGGGSEYPPSFTWSLDGAPEPLSRAALVGDAWGLDRMTSWSPSRTNIGYGYWWKFWFPKTTDDLTGGPPDFNDLATASRYSDHWDKYTAHNGRNNMAFCDGHVKSLDARGMINDPDWWLSAVN